MSAPLSLCSFMTLVNVQGMNAVVVTAPDIEASFPAEEQQAQQDANDLVKALEEVNHKREDLMNK